jgi:predicted transcriptional regulator
MAQKIAGKFYPLQENEWIQVWHELKPADIHLLYYIRSLDAHNNGLELSISDLAKKLGRSKSTVSTSLKALQDKGYVSLEVTHVKVRLLGKGVLHSEQCSLQRTDVLHSEQPFSTANDDSLQRTDVLHSEQSASETQLEQASQPSKINKTYSDFKKTLSDREREKFEKFVREEHRKKTGEEINSFPAFMSGEHFACWWDRFTACVSDTVDWANHPKYEEWKELAIEMPAWFIHEGDRELTKNQRIAFVDSLRSQQQEMA